ncbi:MAG: lysylphosphatidylglycerol synthase transmembrane domain-containing protein [Acidobacteriota bacterium]
MSPSSSRIRRLGSLVLGVAVSALLIGWLLRGEDLGAIGRRLASADRSLLVATAAMITAGAAFRVFRWQVLLRPILPSAPFGACWKAILVGMAVTNLLPGRLGELARPWALGRLAPVEVSGALGTVVLARILDIVALLVVLMAALVSPAFPEIETVLGRPIGDAVAPTVAVAAVALIGVVALLLRPRWFDAIVRVTTAWLPSRVGLWIRGQLDAFVAGLRGVQEPRSLLLALAWSVGLWLWMAASFQVAFAAFGIELGFTAAMFTLCVVSLFVALPAAPGFIGTMHAGVAVSVHDVFGASAESALSLAVGYHLAGFVPITVLGLVYAGSLGFWQSRDALTDGVNPSPVDPESA